MSLSAPSTTFSEDLYTFLWPELGVEMIVERLVEEKTDIRCELTVNSDHPTHGGRLYSGHLLLMGPNSRKQVVNALLDRNPEIDWAGVIEQLCLLSRERYRHGEPVVDLSLVTFGEKARFMVEPFILENGITILYGDGASAKSSLALSWGVQISLARGAVLYLDWEDDAATHAERLKAICSALGTEDAGYGVFYQRRHARLAESVKEIRKIVGEKQIDLIIVDSLGMAAGDPNNSDLMIEAMRAARALGTAVLAIHHLPKNAVDKSKPFGTVYASNEARMTWLVEKTQEEDSDEFTVLLTNHKSNRSKMFAKRAMKIRFLNSEEGLQELGITEVKAIEVEAFRSRLPLWSHIGAVLKTGMSVAEIKAVLAEDGREASEASIRRAIADHKEVFTNIGSTTSAVWARKSDRRETRDAVAAAYSV